MKYFKTILKNNFNKYKFYAFLLIICFLKLFFLSE